MQFVNMMAGMPEQAPSVEERAVAAHRQGPVSSEAARVAVLQATSKLFAERGYERLTMEGVASEAGVSKQTIYRWWPSKGAVIAECLLEGNLFTQPLRLPDTGDVRREIADFRIGAAGLAHDGVGLLQFRRRGQRTTEVDALRGGQQFNADHGRGVGGHVQQAAGPVE